MRIAQVAPLYESCPPQFYGGTERVVANLADALVALGHDVTLFASGDSRTRARLEPISPCGIRLDPDIRDPLPHHVILLERVVERADEFDVIHFHIDFLHFPLARLISTPSLTTLHGRLDLPDLQPFYRTFPDAPLVSISESQRTPMPPVNWLGTVYHGVDPGALPFSPDPWGGYLAFLGRISPEKRPDRAIEIARRVGLPLKIAAKVDNADAAYWEQDIAPLVAAYPNVEFVGEISDDQKPDFLGKALALLFPIDWPEPFGLVMIEAMACGTPVIAFRCGSVPEVIDHGQTGFVVDSVDQAVSAIASLPAIDRAGVRRVFEQRFTAERMACDYLEIYRRLSRSPQPVEPLQLGASRATVAA